MVREIMKSGCEIRFVPEALTTLRLDNSDDLDAIDALEPIHDRLAGSFTERLWWILELIPLTHAWQDANGVWNRSYG